MKSYLIRKKTTSLHHILCLNNYPVSYTNSKKIHIGMVLDLKQNYERYIKSA